MSSESEINTIFTIEVIGRPKEHLVATIEDIIKKLSEEKGVKIITKKVHEPVELKGKKEMFTTFTELELGIQNMLIFQGLIFKYMPSHVEILSPDRINLTNSDLNILFNNLSMNLHRYDEVVRILQIEKAVLQQKLKSILEQLQPKVTAREDLDAYDKKPEETKKKKSKK